MQPIKLLANWLSNNANYESYLFTLFDLRSLLPHLSDTCFKTLMSRAVRSGLLLRICRGIYLYKPAKPNDGLLLYHVAALLRADKFNYISLESSLSDVGAISQIPLNWVSIMSSGRSSIISCGDFGTIEYVHTNQGPELLASKIVYDPSHRLWRANLPQAVRDMKVTGRSRDLIDWSIVNELI